MAYLLVPVFAFLLAAPVQPAVSPEIPGQGAVASASIPSLTLSPFPGARQVELEWDVEIEFVSRDARAAHDFYHREISRQGWQRVDRDLGRREFESDYRRDGRSLELDVEREDGRVEVEIQLDDRRPRGAVSLRDASGFRLAMLPGARAAERQWDIEVTYATRDVRAVFVHYDSLIRRQGWTRVDLERERDEVEATYRRGRAELELEVERDDGEVEVTIEVEDR